MNSLTSTLLASLSELTPYIPLLIPISAILITPIIVAIVMLVGHRAEKMRHETARLALEKGQPLPAFMQGGAQNQNSSSTFTSTQTSCQTAVKSPARDVRSGLILLAIGAALLFSDWHDRQHLALAGTIVGGIGLARLLFGVGVLVFTNRKPPVV